MRHAEDAAGFDRWCEVVSGSFVPLEVEPEGRARPFAGSVETATVGGIGLSTVRAAPHTVHRTPRLAAAGGRGLYKLSLQLEGAGTLLQDGREVRLEPGSLALYDTSRPYTLSFDRDFACHVMMFPHTSLDLPPDMAGQLTATALDGDHHLGAAVAGFLTQAVGVAPDLPPDVGRRLARNVVDLVGTLVSDVLGGGAEAEPRVAAPARAARRAEIEAHVREHLADPGLSPATVAAAHFMSVRALHLLFEGSGTTVAAMIRELRLERCRAELTDARLAGRPVAVVGARWGFPDPAHFSRAFRARYGVAPGRYRRDAA